MCYKTKYSAADVIVDTLKVEPFKREREVGARMKLQAGGKTWYARKLESNLNDIEVEVATKPDFSDGYIAVFGYDISTAIRAVKRWAARHATAIRAAERKAAMA